MNVIPFEPAHIMRMNLQPHQRALVSALPAGYLERLIEAGESATAELDGCILACAGVAYLGWMGTLWAFVAQDAGPHFIRLHRAVSSFLMESPVKRIEATVEVGYTPGCRWLELLKFEQEGILRAYGPHGENHYRYSRIY